MNDYSQNQVAPLVEYLYLFSMDCYEAFFLSLCFISLYMCIFYTPYYNTPATLRPNLLFLQGTVCKDCVYAFFCGPCTWCQIAREIKTRKSPITFVNASTRWDKRLLFTSSKHKRQHYHYGLRDFSSQLICDLLWACLPLRNVTEQRQWQKNKMREHYVN